MALSPGPRPRLMEAGNPPQGNPPAADHTVALWAGLTALFSNLAALEILELVGEESRGAQAVASLGTALIVAAAVYSKQRLADAQAAQRRQARRARKRNDPH
jgi:hypothetical protein